MMKECNVVLDLLPLYLDEMCTEDTKKYVENHFSKCKECRKIYEELKKTKKEDSTKFIEEKQVFKKIRNKNRRNMVIALGFGILITLIFGTRITSVITKNRFENYLKKSYPEYNLKLGHFSYEDPESNGFGINNGFYYGYVYDIDEKKNPDIQFNIFTDGFPFKIKDNFDKSVNKEKETTVNRLMENYSNEIKDGLNKKLKINEITDLRATIEYIDSNEYIKQVESLEINMPYKREIDKNLDIILEVDLELEHLDIEKIADKIDLINGELKKQGFDIKKYNLLVILENELIRFNNINSNYKNINELKVELVKNKEVD